MTMFRVSCKLKLLKEKAKYWNKRVFKNNFQQKQELQDKLQQIELLINKEGRTIKIDLEEKDILTELYNTMMQEETHWKQKSKFSWLRDGDKNTKFYKLSTLNKRSFNKIYEIKDF